MTTVIEVFMTWESILDETTPWLSIALELGWSEVQLGYHERESGSDLLGRVIIDMASSVA
jgi:hypothetical protein